MKIFAKRPAPSTIVEFDVGELSEVAVTFKNTWFCGHFMVEYSTLKLLPGY